MDLESKCLYVWKECLRPPSPAPGTGIRHSTKASSITSRQSGSLSDDRTEGKLRREILPGEALASIPIEFGPDRTHVRERHKRLRYRTNLAVVGDTRRCLSGT